MNLDLQNSSMQVHWGVHVLLHISYRMAMFYDTVQLHIWDQLYLLLMAR